MFLLSATTNLTCSMGLTPSPLNILPLNKVVAQFLPVATIMDNKPMLNIMPFGMCKSPANPAVAAIIASSAGTVTQAPCIPLTLTPWITTKPNILINNIPCINLSSKLMCSYLGIISPVIPGQKIVIS